MTSRTRSVMLVVGLGLLVAGFLLVIGWTRSGPGGGGATSASEGPQPPTAVVTRRSLTARQTVAGTLGYADSRPLAVESVGTITWLPREGAMVHRGGTLLAVNGTPVTIMFGSTPAWRSLQLGITDGPDVAELERNLVVMGFDPSGAITVDDHFDWATAAAVRRWQDGAGEQETGSVPFGRVVFLPGDRRIGHETATLGSMVTPGVEILTTTSTRRVVTVELDAKLQGIVDRGDAVVIDLPSGEQTPGRVSNVGRVATSAPSASQDTGSDSPPTVVVTIGVGHPKATGTLDQAPVDVEIAKSTSKNVLAVPITALLARAGGFAVEVVSGSSRRLVSVRPGLFAGGYVEIVGSRIGEGMRVVNAS